MTTLQQVHVRVTDAATGQPTPCRVRFTDATGTYYAPHGRLAQFALSAGVDVGGHLQIPASDGVNFTFAYIDGGCEIALPPGPLRVTIAKGPEYLPLHQEFQLAPGKLALRFVLQRWSDLRQQRWHPGDTRCHFLTPHAALLEGAAEDLAVVNLLACTGTIFDDHQGWAEPESFPTLSNLLAFSGQQPALERPDCMVVVNTHNSHPVLGSLALLNSHRVVYPLTFGHRHRAENHDNWTLADWCDQCHRKHGLVIWTRAAVKPHDHRGPEALANLILGRVDAVEVTQFGYLDEQHPWAGCWYDVLNLGVRATLVGGSGKNSNYLALGTVRTFARLQPEQPLTYANWIEALRAGRTVATNGPLLTVTVDGHDPGATVHIGEGQPLRVVAEARSVVPFEYLEIVVNGEVVHQQTASVNPCAASVDTEIRVPDGGWVAARCWGKAWLPGFFFAGQRVYAHGSPIYVRVAGRRPPVDRNASRLLVVQLSEMLKWVDTEGRYENDAQRLRLQKVFEDALDVLNRRL